MYKNNKELTLSDLPVIVYDNDANPKFYEFIILENDKEIGTITCFAKKEVPGFTAYVLPFVRDYSKENAVKYSNAYPNISEHNDNLVLSARKTLTEEELNLQREAEEFWADIDKTTLTDLKLAGFIRAWSEEYTIPEFNRDALLRTRFSGACGPAALAWLYRAYNTHYQGVYYPLHGEASNGHNFGLDRENSGVSLYAGGESRLYRDLAERCGVGNGMDPFKDATLPNHLIRAANETFPNHNLVSFPSVKGFPRGHIEGNRPVVLMIRDGFSLHYVVGFGTKNRYNTYNFGLFKVRKVHTDSWIRVSDNGATISRHSHLPYYMNTHSIVGKDFLGVFALFRN